MPLSDIQWLMFLFFAIGALGGVIYLAQLAVELVRTVIAARRLSRRE